MDKGHLPLALLHPRHWLIWLWLALWRLLLIFPYPVLRLLGRGLGALMYRFSRERRAIAVRNIELCFPERDAAARTRLLKDNFFSYGMAPFEIGMAWWWSNRRLAKVVKVKGLEHIETLAEQEKGALLLAAHFTTLEIGASALTMHVDIDGMYRPNDNPVFDHVQRRGRERRAKVGAAYPREDLRGILKALRGGRILWYAPDQDYGRKQTVFAPFFGMPASSVTATARLAQMGRAAVLPFTHYRLPGNAGYEIRVHPPLEGFPTGDDVADATRINALVESYVHPCPEQYMWLHRRFKTRPEGDARVYPVRRRRRHKGSRRR